MDDKELKRLCERIRGAYPVKTLYEELHEMAHPMPWVWAVYFTIVFGAVGALLIWGRG